MNPLVSIGSPAEAARVAGERRSQHLITAFVITGLLFMLLPGTFLGVWNLLNISREHGPASISQAWIQAHGQAQIFGWIGSFILGIGYYSLTKMKSTRAFPAGAAWTSWVLWSAGVLARWFGASRAMPGKSFCHCPAFCNWRRLLCSSSRCGSIDRNRAAKSRKPGHGLSLRPRSSSCWPLW